MGGGRGRGKRLRSKNAHASDEEEEELSIGKGKEEEDDEEEEGEHEEEEMALSQAKRVSRSKQFAAIDGSAKASERRNRGAKQQTLVELVGSITPSSVLEQAVEDRPPFVPSKLRKSPLDYVAAESQREVELKSAKVSRQSKGKFGKKRNLDPADLPAEAWVFYRTAREGENPDYVYCRASESSSQNKCDGGKLKISKDKDGKPFLKVFNAESHLGACHKSWWAAVRDAASKGKQPRKVLDGLIEADEKKPRQRHISVIRTSKPGRFEKEVAWLVFIIRNRLSFNVLNDEIGFAAVRDACDINMRGADTIKGLTFGVHEAAVRDTVSRIRQAGAYSITLDYWTALNGDHYLSITYHWTDENWNVCAQTLDLVPVKCTASGAVTFSVVDARTKAHFAARELWGESVRP